MGNVTIRILARELQLSAATVSKALADSHEISSSTKKRVLEMAAALNYTPNPYASSLRRKKSKTIAVVLPEVADSFFSQAIDGIEAIAQDKGYHVLVCLTHERALKERSILHEMLGGRADGILISVCSETTDSSSILELQEKGVPVVFFDRICEDLNASKVVTDDRNSGYKAADHLIRCGCRKIAFLAISENLSISHERIEGYKHALNERGMRFSQADIIPCTHHADDNVRLLKRILSEKDHPDGIIASVEKLAVQVYQACRESELRIPGDVKVIGFSNLVTASLLNPSLTTITQPAFEMGRAAATMLFKALNNKTADMSQSVLVIPSELQVRDSTG
ncbi:MAG TPA: LacI family DNA-binding transcriptional regulator [Puia sp.]|jgi:LacI family transcriptional regulator